MVKILNQFFCVTILEGTYFPKGPFFFFFNLLTTHPPLGFIPVLRLFPGCHWDCPISQECAGALLGKGYLERRLSLDCPCRFFLHSFKNCHKGFSPSLSYMCDCCKFELLLVLFWMFELLLFMVSHSFWVPKNGNTTIYPCLIHQWAIVHRQSNAICMYLQNCAMQININMSI